MRERLTHTFSQIKNSGHRAFIPFSLPGWTDSETWFKAAKMMLVAGCDALLLGSGMSHSVADSRTVRAATFELLAAGFSLSDSFALIKRVRSLDSGIPLVLVIYRTMIEAHGIEYCLSQTVAAGLDGLMIPDLVPLPEGILKLAGEKDLAIVPCISELTHANDIKSMSKCANGFVYAFLEKPDALTPRGADEVLSALVSTIRSYTELPLIAGAGDLGNEKARKLLDIADGFVSGGEIIEMMDYAREQGDPLSGLESYLLSMIDACCS